MPVFLERKTTNKNTTKRKDYQIFSQTKLTFPKDLIFLSFLVTWLIFVTRLLLVCYSFFISLQWVTKKIVT